ncbi:hypothetical protein RND81_05G172600 [Saponaria officinalis]|uniref:C2H2-type domain-containing protein n=1 Tax=Saponaria officinalis TaxID=3572 RepID=A0AAW1KZ54_SAPOF
MQTQEQKSLNHTGSSGHGGVHVCHKCGWSFPNPHPSSKQRRAHKKVCGTIQGHRLDDDGAPNNAHVEGHVGELNADDDLKTTSGNVAERILSRRSSSGVGSKSSGSIRSDDDVYMDAVSENSENVATITRLASDGVMERFYSMDNRNEMDDNEPAREFPAGTDNLSTPDLLEDNNLQTVQRVDSENAVDQNMIQSSEQSEKLDYLDTISESGQEFVPNKDESVFITSNSEKPEEVAEELLVPKGASDELKRVSENVLDSMSADVTMKATTLMKSDGIDDNSERFDDVDFLEKVNSPENICPPVPEVGHVNSENSNIRKSDVIEEHESKIDAVNHEGGQSNFSNAMDEKVEYIKASEDIDVRSSVDKQEDCEKSVHVQKTFREQNQMSDANSSNDSKHKNSEEEKDEMILDSRDVIAQREGCIDENGTADTLMTDGHVITTLKSVVNDDVESSCERSAVVDHRSDERVSENSSCVNEGDRVINHHAGISTVHTVLDSGSQTGSLDVNWGSVSVMSTTSDAQPTTDTIVPKSVIEDQRIAKTEVEIEQIENVPDIQAPAIADVANEPDRGNKGSGKQRTPLKMLLGEDIARSRAESPVHSNGTGNATRNSDNNGTETEAAQEETGKEWNSPEEKIEVEKRQTKNKSYWVPFFCCSSVNTHIGK